MKKLAILAALSLLAACAEPAANTATSEPRAQKEYSTGSNIPRRPGSSEGPSDVQVYDADAVKRSQESSYGGIPRVPQN